MKKGSASIKGNHTPRLSMHPSAIGMQTPKTKSSSAAKSAVVKKVTMHSKKAVNTPVVSSNSESRENRSRAGFAGGLSKVHKAVKVKAFSK